MKKADDSFLYLKTENPQIEKCLNCTRKKCNGTCEHMVTPKEYVIKRTWKTSKGETRESYLRAMNKDNVLYWTKDIHQALKRTHKGAENKLKEVKTYTKEGVFEVVKYDEECKKIGKEQRKTYRGVCRHYVDANGNILGKQY